MQETDHILFSNVEGFHKTAGYFCLLRSWQLITGLLLHSSFRTSPRCNHTVFHLEILKDLTCAQEYAMSVSNLSEVLDTIDDHLELWDTFKFETLKVPKECVRDCPRSQNGFAYLGRCAGQY